MYILSPFYMESLWHKRYQENIHRVSARVQQRDGKLRSGKECPEKEQDPQNSNRSRETQKKLVRLDIHSQRRR